MMMEAPNDCSEKYSIMKKIGTGSFATVWLGVDRKNRRNVALKAISKDRLTEKLLENVKSEMSILREFVHPHLVELVEIIETPIHLLIALEYVEGGDLQKYIRKRGRLPCDTTARRFMIDFASGLAFLWSKRLIHRDLKPQNLLLTRNDDSARLKIADFGFARKLETATMAETLCGSPLYMAPEILSHKRYDAKADLWSVGAILFEMLVGKPPFSGGDTGELLRNIKRTTLVLPADVEVSQDCIKLLQGLLKRTPSERISLQAFVDCEYCLPSDHELNEQSQERGRVPSSYHGTAPHHSSSSSSGSASRTTISSVGRVSSLQQQQQQRPQYQHHHVAASAATQRLLQYASTHPKPNPTEPPNTNSSGEFVVVDHGMPRRRRRRSALTRALANEGLRCASTLGWVGDSVSDRPIEALAVYVHALHVLRGTLKAVESTSPAASSDEPSEEETLKSIISLARHQVAVLLARADDANQACRDPSVSSSSSSSLAAGGGGGSFSSQQYKQATARSAAAVVYHFAMENARAGAASESRGEPQDAAKRYALASRCLASLLFSFKLEDADRTAILQISRGPIDRALERVQRSDALKLD